MNYDSLKHTVFESSGDRKLDMELAGCVCEAISLCVHPHLKVLAEDTVTGNGGPIFKIGYVYGDGEQISDKDVEEELRGEGLWIEYSEMNVDGDCIPMPFRKVFRAGIVTTDEGIRRDIGNATQMYRILIDSFKRYAKNSGRQIFDITCYINNEVEEP